VSRIRIIVDIVPTEGIAAGPLAEVAENRISDAVHYLDHIATVTVRTVVEPPAVANIPPVG
jgi:hypothetical protein